MACLLCYQGSFLCKARCHVPWVKRGFVDEVIEPSQTREKLIAGFEMLENKHEEPIKKKHGNIPL